MFLLARIGSLRTKLQSDILTMCGCKTRTVRTNARAFRPPMEPLAVVVIAVLIPYSSLSQNLPLSPNKPWHSSQQKQFERQLGTYPDAYYSLDANRVYSLADLVDLAERQNPETRVAWENAKAHAEAVGVAHSALFPTITAVALASTWRVGVLIGPDWHRQTVGLFQPTLNLSYLIFDFGGRGGAIAEAKAELFAADFAFNDTHRRVIYQVTAAYYRLLNAVGQEVAAQATLANTQAVQRDAESRMQNGLATLPDVLEARAAAAEADYDLQAAVGAKEIAYGDLSTTLGLPPSSQFQVQDISELSIPDGMSETADHTVDRALEQRPDLLEQVAKVRAADAAIKQERSTYFPKLEFSGIGGLQRAYGQQDLLPGAYAESETWNVQLNLQWNLFDGMRREHALSEDKARRRQAQGEIKTLRDQISDEVWTAYSNAKTSLRQKQAAAALLASADQSYSAALRAYDLGVRNLLDVVAAERSLAQARSFDITARTQVLTQMSNLAFRTGDLLRAPAPKAAP
jgi:outer membrane protein